ncbi:MAG TPA: protein translocase subunit SecF [Candidatus Nanoarchaeia archaeon]|nr:protein translocase subunit SecF [Candidatus Nanoarchaeia archaeon]
MSKKAKRREEARLQEWKQTSTAPVAAAEAPAEKASGLAQFFDRHYRLLMIFPTLFLLFAIGQIAYQVTSTGDFSVRSVSLSGGTQITVLRPDLDATAIEEALRTRFPDGGVSVTKVGSGLVLAARYSESADTDRFVSGVSEELQLSREEYSVEIVGATLGQSFFRQTMIALAIAFVFMSTVVFISFRNIAPSLFVVLAALADIITTLAIFNVFGFELTTASIAAFLMLIGYSIDTDVLLTSRVLRRKYGTISDATVGAFTTGATMSVTTLCATLIGLSLTQSELLRQMMFIIFTGVIVDMVYTWCYNAPILKWYLERKAVHG